MRVSCKRMGVSLVLHLLTIAVYGGLVNLVACNTWRWKEQDWFCSDYSPQLAIILVTANVISQMILPCIPAFYLHSVLYIL